MINQLTTHDIAEALNNIECFGNNEYDACYTMAEWLEQFEEDTGEQMELDPVAIRCEFNLSTKQELVDTYSYSFNSLDVDNVIELLQDETIIIPVDGEYFIVQDF